MQSVDNKRPLKVFLCHAHADRDAVRGLYIRLTKDGVDAWLDKEKLLPGQDWELEIRKAVREADVVVVCLSKQFNQAGFRQKEVRLALDTAMEQPEGEIFIIPARLEECETLESLKKWHWVDLFEENGYGKLLTSLQIQAKKDGLAWRENEPTSLSEPAELINIDRPSNYDASNREKSLNAVRIQLLSTLPSDVWQGFRQVDKWLQEDLEAQDVYRLLLDVVEKNHGLLDKVREILRRMIQKGSESAIEILNILPVVIGDLIAWADDAYYGTDYEEAIGLYRRVLKLEPDNQRAKDQLAKAELLKITEVSNKELPRVAVQYYRRARSFIAAQDWNSAIQLLSAAVETAKAKGMEYPDAEQLLNSVQDKVVADEYKTKAENALSQEKWEDALVLYEKALLLNPIDEACKRVHGGLKSLVAADAVLSMLMQNQIDKIERKGELEKIKYTLHDAREINDLVKTTLLRTVQEKYNKLNRFSLFR